MDSEPQLQTGSILKRLGRGFALRVRPSLADNATEVGTDNSELARKSNDDYLTATLALENEILASVPNTSRNISAYSRNLGFTSTEEFINGITGKKIVDMGSGFDGFALDVILQGIDATVISVNPARTTSSFANNRRKKIEEWRQSLWRHNEMLAIDAALLEVDQHAIAAFAHDLSVIPDEQVDMVIDNEGVFYYSNPKNEKIYERSIKEMLRIVKPGGRILIGDSLHMQLGAKPWYKKIFDRLGLSYRYLETDTGKPGLARRYGVEVTKPEATAQYPSQIG